MATRFSMYAVLAQQTERTRGSSATQIKELITESDSKITLLRNEIAALESRIAALIELRDLERAAGDALRSLTAPIRMLPVELLAEIFLLSIRDGSNIYSGSKSWHIQDAFRVSHVCREWRQIANSTLRLWTGPMTVDFRQQRYLTEEGSNGLETWLARSAPLSVPITVTGLVNQSWLTESGSRLTEILLCIAARWRWLRFVDYTVPGSFIQRLAGSRLDSLEELVLWSVEGDDLHFDPTTILSFTTAPRLRNAILSTACRIPMPWAQLTDITLEGRISLETFRNIFSQCINVVNVSLIAIGWAVFSPIQPDALALNQLRFLSVTSIGGEDGMQFFACISAPALDELRLCFEDGDIEWAEDAFTAFQLRSPNITKLTIEGRGLPVPSHALIAAFRHAPSLTHCSIDHCPDSVDDHFCQALCYTADAEPLVPHLHTLAIAETDGNLSQDGLATMIASRWWSDAELASRSRPRAVARWRQIRLQTDAIDSSFEFSSAFRGAIYALRKTGLDVDFVESEDWRLDW
ncbi:hypothetical protein C8R45DRAFT_484646 [Mycena sanguinolenta]|nr:hypothetical protein C8R45DRAFT_484646 [Mycena sanguinolenta]